MPVYEYRCAECASIFEKLVALSTEGDHVTLCPDCGGRADKQFSTFAAVGVKSASGGGCCGGGGGCACAP